MSYFNIDRLPSQGFSDGAPEGRHGFLWCAYRSSSGPKKQVVRARLQSCHKNEKNNNSLRRRLLRSAAEHLKKLTRLSAGPVGVTYSSLFSFAFFRQFLFSFCCFNEDVVRIPHLLLVGLPHLAKA